MSSAASISKASISGSISGPSATPPAARAVRSEPRLKLPAMYTLIRVRLTGDEQYRWSGHVYDISMAGMRFELDEPIEPGTAVDTRIMLPGHRQTLLRVSGHVVRLHDDDEPILPPVRMGMAFDQFASTIDQYRLSSYLADAGLKREARQPVHRRAA